MSVLLTCIYLQYILICLELNRYLSRFPAKIQSIRYILSSTQRQKNNSNYFLYTSCYCYVGCGAWEGKRNWFSFYFLFDLRVQSNQYLHECQRISLLNVLLELAVYSFISNRIPQHTPYIHTPTYCKPDTSIYKLPMDNSK